MYHFIISQNTRIFIFSFLLEEEIKEIRAKWKGLRNIFRIHLLNAHISSGAAAQKNIVWPYYKAMLFMKDTMIAR